MAAPQKPSAGPVSRGLGTPPLRLDDHEGRERQYEDADADAERGRVERAEGVHADGRAEGARDHHRGKLAVADVLAGLNQHETERQDRNRIYYDHDGLRIEIEQQHRRSGEAEPETDGADGKPGNRQHQG